MQAATQRLSRIALALGIGSLGALAGWGVGLPLPFMLGAMLATMVAALAGLPMAMPKAVRLGVAPVLGVMFGSAIGFDGLPATSTVIGLSILVALHLALTISLGWLYFRWIGFDPATSYFAAVPGNFSDMILFADRLGADLRAVTVVHTVRLVAAVSILAFGLRLLLGPEMAAPFPPRQAALTPADLLILIASGVAGYAAARLVRLPAPQLFGPLFAAAVVHGAGWTDAAPPGWLIAASQLVLGVFAGVRFVGIHLHEVWRLVLASLVWSVLLLALVAGSSALAAFLLDLHLATPLLAFSPGGAAELNMMALTAGLSVALVSMVQLVRMVLTLLVGPALLGVLIRRRGVAPD